ncbi:hypothetical protein T492DRAFT_845942 [Pavlovales sp. CCMP2436]|nr:hypothetical protein T492DRAFT_845942 [Pavlovales sp. CCMP2436]
MATLHASITHTPELRLRRLSAELLTSVGEHMIPRSLATRLCNSRRRFFSPPRRRATFSPEHELQSEDARSASRKPSPSLLAAPTPRNQTLESAVEPLHSQESHIRAKLDYSHRVGQKFRWNVQLQLAATGIIGMVVAIILGVFSVV